VICDSAHGRRDAGTTPDSARIPSEYSNGRCGPAAGDNPGQRETALLYAGNATIDILHDIAAARVENYSGHGTAVRNLNTAATHTLAEIQQKIESRLWQESLVNEGAGRCHSSKLRDVAYGYCRAQLRSKKSKGIDVRFVVDSGRQSYRINASRSRVGITTDHNH
jgi:hypothetical protein